MPPLSSPDGFQPLSAGPAGLARLPGCLFAPPGEGPRSLFARDETGALRHISEVETGTTGLLCPDCRTPLIARKGEIRQPHFAHKSGEDCRTAGETVLHFLAKEIIATGGELHLPSV